MQLSVPWGAAPGGRMGDGSTTKLITHWEQLEAAFARGAVKPLAGWGAGAGEGVLPHHMVPAKPTHPPASLLPCLVLMCHLP